MNFTFFDNTAAYFPDVCFALPPDLGIMLGSGWGEALEAACYKNLMRFAKLLC